MLKYNLGMLKNAIMDFNTITGLMIVLYDGDFNIICSHPGMNSFCKEIRKSRELTGKCLRCDLNGLRQCRERREMVIYKCHMGLTEAIAPIVDGGSVIGYLMVGQQIEAGEREEIAERVMQLPDGVGADKELLLLSLGALSVMSREKLLAAAKIMEMCACYLYANGIVRKEDNRLRDEIDSYIKENLSSRELSLSGIARHLSVSRSTLYSISRELFGMGITDYVRQTKIERAKELLKSGELPIYEISALCGFPAANHFTKTFKQIVGVLPKDYQKNQSDSE